MVPSVVLIEGEGCQYFERGGADRGLKTASNHAPADAAGTQVPQRLENFFQERQGCAHSNRLAAAGTGLTCDVLVTYNAPVSGDDSVFKALADPTRRLLLDNLFERDGRTLSELECEFDMTRFGVMKHLRILEGAGLVVTRRSGREKLHFLNPIPIQLIHDRWIHKYSEHHVSALLDLKSTLEKEQ